jgi:peptidoglycan/LPS O-acetylase OafA/YrhL
MSSTYLSDILESKSNNFTLLRLLAALAVVVSHAVFLLSGNKSDETFSGVSVYTLGDHAVNIFFVLSGLTVAASLDRSRNTVNFLIARMLRIFPALIVCTGLLILLGIVIAECGPGHYLSDTRVAKYFLKTVSLISGSAELPGVFTNNPHPLIVNASLWTLKFEVLCYVLLTGLGALGLIKKPTLIWFLPATWLIAGSLLWYRYGGHGDPFEQMARFWLCFSYGVGLFVFHDRIKLSWVIVIALASLHWLVLATAWERIIAPFVIGYAAIWLGSLPITKLREYTNTNDFSYGVYIFGWPISQTLLFATPQIGVLTLIALSIVISLVLAALSWHLVEKPSLRLRGLCSTFIDRWISIKKSVPG